MQEKVNEANCHCTLPYPDSSELIKNDIPPWRKKIENTCTDIIDLNGETAIEAFKEMVLHKRNLAMDEYEVLSQLKKVGLTDTANYLHTLL